MYSLHLKYAQQTAYKIFKQCTCALHRCIEDPEIEDAKIETNLLNPSNWMLVNCVYSICC